MVSSADEPRSRVSAFIGGVASAGVPIATCPACWPAYVGIAGSLGLGFLTRGPAVLPFAAALLAVALFPLAYRARARARRSFGPLALGVLGAAVVAIGRFTLGSDPVMLSGGGLLVLASVWNAWPHRARACASCVPRAELIQLEPEEV